MGRTTCQLLSRWRCRLNLVLLVLGRRSRARVPSERAKQTRRSPWSLVRSLAIRNGSCCVGCGLGEGPCAPTPRRASRNECVSGCGSFPRLPRARTIQLRLWAAEGDPARPETMAARRWAACFWLRYCRAPHENRPWAAGSGDYGSRLRLAGPARHQGSIRAPVIIRFPRAAANELLLANIDLDPAAHVPPYYPHCS